MTRRVEETIMQYTEYVYWDDNEVVGTERMDDDHSYDIRATREPTVDELTDYYPTEPQEHAAQWDGESRPHLCGTCGARVVSRLESWVHLSGDPS